MINRYEEALPDFEQVVKLAPEYKKGYLNRGTTKKHLTDYEGALADYAQVLQIDSNYADAYYNRGLVYDILSNPAAACADFNKAKELGLKNAQRKVDQCNDTTAADIPTTPIVRLTKKATDDKYGFTPEHPVKVGTGPEGGPANQQIYLELLRDAQGQPISYERQGSCCM